MAMIEFDGRACRHRLQALFCTGNWRYWPHFASGEFQPQKTVAIRRYTQIFWNKRHESLFIMRQVHSPVKELYAVLACIFTRSLPGATAGKSGRDMQLAVDVRYYYGSWQWGDFKMTPRAGMAGPDLRL